MEEQYNYKQVIAYAVIGLEHYLNSGNKDNINIKDFCNLFMEPLEKIYKKKDVIRIANILLDKDHKNFFYSKLDKLQSLRKTDVYYLSLVYTLSICETTREHFSSIFNIEKGEINLDAIKAGWQTGTSEKVTRMAFNLWNHSIMFDSEEDCIQLQCVHLQCMHRSFSIDSPIGSRTELHGNIMVGYVFSSQKIS